MAESQASLQRKVIGDLKRFYGDYVPAVTVTIPPKTAIALLTTAGKPAEGVTDEQLLEKIQSEDYATLGIVGKYNKLLAEGLLTERALSPAVFIDGKTSWTLPPLQDTGKKLGELLKDMKPLCEKAGKAFMTVRQDGTAKFTEPGKTEHDIKIDPPKNP